MQEPNCELPGETAEVLELGVVLGQNQAFGLVAGRCSAAQAAGLRRLREERLYRHLAPDWRDFCSAYLRISGSEADRIIHLWEEFGPSYFELAQLTRISPATYRAIAPAVKDGVLHFNGNAIELNVENSRKVAAAVAELRRGIPGKKPPHPPEMHERLADLDRRCAAIIAEFQEISQKERCGENWLLFTATLARVSSALQRLERENDLT